MIIKPNPNDANLIIKFNMLKKASECDKAFGYKNNYKIDFKKGEII